METKMKKNVVLIMLLALSLLLNTAYADQVNPKIDLKQTPDYYTRERQQKIVEYNRELENIKPQIFATTSATYGRNVKINLYFQELSYYCGPASVRMALSAYMTTPPSQSYLARPEDLNTNSSQGTYVYKIAQVMQKRAHSGYDYHHTSDTNMWNSVFQSLDKKAPVIFHVMTGGLPGYTSNLGHYITGFSASYERDDNISPYSNEPQAIKNQIITYYDPYYKTTGVARANVSYQKMLSAVNANHGYWISR